MMNVYTLLLLLLCLFPIRSVAAQPVASPGVQHITAEEITQAGLVRLSDLFSLIDTWHATSVEGYAWDVSANALASAREAAWMVFVDGNPVDLRVLDTQNINTLPLSLSEVAYVEVHNTPTFIAGQYAPAGVLHLHTRAPTPGASVKANLSAGNEIGDPGPFRYTSFSSANIDRIGPRLEGAASTAGAGWHARIHARMDEHHSTDERMRQRVLTFYQGLKEPRLLLASVGLDAGMTNRLGAHSLFAGYTRYQDLPFFEPVGLETPTDHLLYHAGLRGDTDPGERTGMSYRLSYTVSELDPRNNRGGVGFDWRQSLLRGHYEVRTASEHVQGALGLSMDAIESVASTDLTDARLRIPRAYGRFGYAWDARGSAHLTTYITRVKGEVGYGLLATARYTPIPAHTLTITGTVARQPYQEKNSLWYWISQGYSFRVRRDVDLSLPSGFDASTTYTLDAGWAFHPSDYFSLTLTAGLRRFDKLTLANYTFHYDALSTGFTTDTDVLNHVSGRATHLGGAVRFRLHPTLHQRLQYSLVRYPTDNDTFFQAWRSQPWHRVSYTIRYTPVSRLSLYARLGYHSKTQWTGFLQAARDSGGRYQADLPGYWILDLSAGKRFWRDHLQLNLALRNFLNEAYRTHPAGAVTNMALQVRILAYFNVSGAS